MKIKRVKSERDVKGGQFYIRAVINYTGDHWIEVFRIVGKAFNTESIHMPGYRKLTTVRKESYSPKEYLYESYTGDLGIGRKGGFLLEYSSKVHSYLKSLSKREFNDVVNCTSLNDGEWESKLDDWEFQKYMDSHMDDLLRDDYTNYQINSGIHNENH